MLPTIMQDEYVYLSQSLLFPDANLYGNFLHSFLYSFVVNNANDFYFAAKLLNALFLALFALSSLFLARKLLPSWSGLVFGLLTVFGATSLYSSVFMPEIMFYAFAAWSMALLVSGLSSEGGPRYFFFAGSVLSLVFAGLTKPHAMILLFGLLTFFSILFGLRRISARDAGFLSAIYFVGYGVLKIGLGYLLAGRSGLTLIGEAYEAALLNFLDGVRLFNSGALSASSGALNPVDHEGFTGFALFSVTQVPLLLLSFLLMTWGLPLLLARSPSNLTDFQILVLTVAICFIIFISAFTGLISYSGDDHSDRLLLRYFEFLGPISLLAVFIEISKSEKLIGPRRLVLISSAPLLGILWLVVLGGVDAKLADSAVLLGIFRDQLLLWIVIITFTVIVILVDRRPKKNIAIASIVVLCVNSLVGLSAQQRQLDLNSTKISPDFAGETLRRDFASVPGHQIIVVGPNKQFAAITKFWSLKPEVDHLIIPQGSRVLAEDPAFDGYELIVELPGVELGGGQVVADTQGFRIIVPFTD